MRVRLLLTILLLLVAGAVASLCVGSVAGWTTVFDGDTRTTHEEGLAVVLRHAPDLPWWQPRTYAGSGPLVTRHRVFDIQRSSDVHLWEIEAGWPLRCLRGATILDEPFSFPPSVSVEHFALIPGDRHGRGLPYGPLWGGLAVDTVFYAVVLALPVVGVARMRRARWVRRGLCPACAYPVGESATCSECGAEAA